MRIIALATALSVAASSVASAQAQLPILQQNQLQTPPGTQPAVGAAPSPTAAAALTAPSSGGQNNMSAAALGLGALAGLGGAGQTQLPAALPPSVITTTDGVQVPVFGQELFTGSFAGSRPGDRPDYRIQPGDQISITLYGALTVSAVQTVDASGNVFIPAVGPVPVAGVTASQLQTTLQNRVHTFYTSAVGVYANVVQAGTIGVFVTGDVMRPGRFNGGAHDSVLYFLSQAGGVDATRGSFRNLTVMRNGAPIATYDLYDFLVNGRTEALNFADGDVIVAAPRGAMIGVTGAARNAYAFEAPRGSKTMTGADLLPLARPEANVTSVSVRGFRNGAPQSAYFTLDDFARVVLGDGDHVEFRSDSFVQNVTVKIVGEVRGPSVYVMPRGSTLGQLLARIPLQGTDIEPRFVHIQRPDVAIEQKRALNDALWNLQKQVLTAAPITEEQAQFSTAQAALVAQFVQRAQSVQPDGNIAVYTNGQFNDVVLRDNDTIILPNRTDVVLITGEILTPGALAWSNNATVAQYVSRAGGFSPNANKGKIVIRHLDGSAQVADQKARPGPGDELVVVPKVGSPWLIIAKDLTQILFQIAVTAGTVIRLSDNNS